MRCIGLAVLLLASGLVGLEQSFSDTVFPPQGWTVVNADSGVRVWQRLDVGCRTEPGCAYCGWENASLRNSDWLITPQCSVTTGSYFTFWARAQTDEWRESLEVWVSTSSPRPADFRRERAFGTSSPEYEFHQYMLGQYLDRKVFLALVYRSLNQYGLMVDDVSGPTEWNPIHDLGISRTVGLPGFTRIGASTRPGCWVHNWGQFSEWTQVSYEAVGLWREDTGIGLAPGESCLVQFPGIAFWQPDTVESVFATHLGADQRYWNDSSSVRMTVHPFQSRGGPDSAGYVWFDSDDPLGPEYCWQEIYPTGLLLGWGDDSLHALNLEWPFPFYGQECTLAFVCTNGWLAFGPPSPGNPTDSNAAIPSRYNPNRLIAAFWDDLWVKGNEGGIWYDYFGDSMLVIEWRRVRRKGCSAGSLNFEVKLFRDGAIEFHYAGTEAGDSRYDGGMSATVGIENSLGTIGLQYLFDGQPAGNLLSSGRAIRLWQRVPGVEEGQEPIANRQEPMPTVVRGVLFLSCRSDFQVANRGKDAAPAALLDACGRKVMELRPGENDVRHLPAGIYFVRRQSVVSNQHSGRQASTVSKVIVTR